jgi:hypothetical protein
MARFFGPVGSAASGAGKGLVTSTTHFRASVEGKMVQEKMWWEVIVKDT